MSSGVANPAVMATVPLARVALSRSATVIALVICVGALFSVYEIAPTSMAASTGASFTGVTVMPRMSVLLASAPSLTVKLTVRAKPLGLSLLLK